MDRDSVLAMYDIRGIQKYIFKTTKVKEAMGASALVDTIIMDALNWGWRGRRNWIGMMNMGRNLMGKMVMRYRYCSLAAAMPM